MKKGIKITIIVVSSIVLLILLIAIFISPIAKNYIEKNSKELVGRKISMENLKINIFTGTLKIDNLNLYEKNEKDKFVSFDTLDVDVSLWKLVAKKVNIDHIYLSGFSATVLQKGDWFNFNDIIEHFSKKDTNEKKDTTPSDWKIILHDIRISKSKFVYKDLLINSQWKLKDLALNIPIIDLSNVNSKIDVGLNFVEGGSLKTKIKWAPEKNSYLVGVSLKNFSVGMVLPYLQESMNLKNMTGKLTTNLKIKGQTQHLMNFTISGDATLNNFSLTDNKNRNVVSFDKFYTDVKNVDLNKNQYLFNTLTINGISSMFEMYKNNTNNFSFLMKPTKQSKKSAKNTKNEKEKPMIVKIENLKINVKEFKISDLTILEPFHYKVSDINVNSKHFSLNQKNKIDVSANLGKGNLKVNYDGNFNSLSNMELTINMKNVQLKDFSAYCVNMFSCPLTKGTLALRSQTRIANNMLKSVNKLDLYEPKVGKKNKKLNAEYKKIPLALGLYVITDKDNKAVFNIPVTGNISNPKFSYKKIVIKTVCNLLIKVAEAPFTLLGKALGISGDGLHEIDLRPGQKDFSSEQYGKLSDIAKVLKSKTEMTVSFKQKISYEDAIEQLSTSILKKQYYLSLHPELNNSSIDLFDKEDVKKIDINSNEVKTFLDNELKKNNLSTDGSSKEKAIRLYGMKAEERLVASCQERNTKLISYLTTKEGIAANRIKVSTMSIEEMKKESKTQYKVTLSVNGEEE